MASIQNRPDPRAVENDPEWLKMRRKRDELARIEAEDEEARAAKAKKRPRRKPAPSRKKKKPNIVMDLLFGEGLLLILIAAARSMGNLARSLVGFLAGTSSAQASDRPGDDPAMAAAEQRRSASGKSRAGRALVHTHDADDGSQKYQWPEEPRRTIEEVREFNAKRDRDRQLPNLRAAARSEARQKFGSPMLYAALGKRIAGNLDAAEDIPGAYAMVAGWNHRLADILFTDVIPVENDEFQALRSYLLRAAEKTGDIELAVQGMLPVIELKIAQVAEKVFPKAGPELSAHGGDEVGAARLAAALNNPPEDEPPSMRMR